MYELVLKVVYMYVHKVFNPKVYSPDFYSLVGDIFCRLSSRVLLYPI